MKIELEVDPGALGTSLADIMNSLTPEQRNALAVQAMEKWLRDPYDVERKAQEQKVLDRLRGRGDTWGRKETDEQIRGGYDFRNEMQSWRSSKEIMIDAITLKVIEHYKAEVTRVVNEDPKIQAMKAEVTKLMMETFPKIAHDAMTLFVADQFQAMLSATHSLSARVERMGTDTQQIGQRLMQIAQSVGFQG